jgi:tripartite-type tricarboxylate transporter receptor subunit TctC
VKREARRIGSIQHLAGELFNTTTGVKLAHVPYRGTNQVIVDFLGGRLSLMFAPAPTIASHLDDARVKPLAVTSAKRSGLYPNLPTLSESGIPDFDAPLWFGIWGPKDMQPHVVAALSNVIEQVSRTTEGKPAAVEKRMAGDCVYESIELFQEALETLRMMAYEDAGGSMCEARSVL